MISGVHRRQSERLRARMHAEVAARASLFRHKLAGHRFGLVGKLQGDGVVGVAGEQAGGAVWRHAALARMQRGPSVRSSQRAMVSGATIHQPTTHQPDSWSSCVVKAIVSARTTWAFSPNQQL